MIFYYLPLFSVINPVSLPLQRLKALIFLKIWGRDVVTVLHLFFCIAEIKNCIKNEGFSFFLEETTHRKFLVLKLRLFPTAVI